MPPLLRRTVRASLPTLLSLSKVVQLIPRATQQWSLDSPAGGDPAEPEDPPDSPMFWWKLGLSAVLVLSGGAFAGLTLALMGSDDLNLRVLSASSSDPKERRAANKVLRLLEKGRHWVLVVLLLGNVIVNESLPIFLNDVLGGGLAAVIVSTTMIVIFGEIIPQAICVRYGLAIGGVCAPLVWAMMILFCPIAWPIAKLLDYVLGPGEGHTYKKAELKSFLQFHREGEEPLRDDEIGILNGVLSLNDKHAVEIMTPLEDCLTLPTDRTLDHETIDQILLSGFSRIPVHEPGQKKSFVGMLLVKKLISYNPEDEWPVSRFTLLPLPEAKPDINCFQALDYFQTGRAHLLLISETPGVVGGALGIVSLEDLIEEIIGEEIVDETDRYEDNHSKRAVKRSGTAAVMRGIIERRRVLHAFSHQPDHSNSNTPLIGPSDPTTTSTADGILIQISDGNLVAETVGLSENGTASTETSQRMVLGTNEAGSQAGAIGGNQRMVHQADSESLISDNSRDYFPDHASFERACKAMIEMYKGVSEGELGAGRTNRGWEWKEHKFVPHQGYLSRNTVRYCSPSLISFSLDHQGPPSDAGDGLEEEDLETEDTALLPEGELKADKKVKVEVEQHIVYSKTYRVPMFCFRAWDETGAPVSIPLLLKLNIIHADSPPQQLQFGEYGAALDTLMLPTDVDGDEEAAAFPIIQSTEHPTTGQLVFSIHPCKVSGAVEEILEANFEEHGVRDNSKWLEIWMMLTGRVADLTFP